MPRRWPRRRPGSGPTLLLVLALVSLLVSAGLALSPVQAEVLGIDVDCGASVMAGSHAGEGLLAIEGRLACHDAAGPWRAAALVSALLSLTASAAATVGLRRRASTGVAVPPPA